MRAKVRVRVRVGTRVAGGGDHAPAEWSQDCIDFVKQLDIAELARYRSTTLRGRTPNHIAPKLAAAINASMRGMDAAAEADQELGWRVHLFACRALRAPTRGGRRAESLTSVLSKRIDAFNGGKWRELWTGAPNRPMRARGARTDEETAKHVAALVNEGLYSRGAAALEAGELAPATQATHDALKALHPDGSNSGPMPDANPAPAPPTLDPELFQEVFCKPPRGSAHGTSGWRMEDYAMVAEHCVPGGGVEASRLFKVASALAAGRIPRVVRPYFAGGRLIGLAKPPKPDGSSGGVRPIVIGEALRRMSLAVARPS